MTRGTHYVACGAFDASALCVQRKQQVTRTKEESNTLQAEVAKLTKELERAKSIEKEMTTKMSTVTR